MPDAVQKTKSYIRSCEDEHWKCDGPSSPFNYMISHISCYFRLIFPSIRQTRCYPLRQKDRDFANGSYKLFSNVAEIISDMPCGRFVVLNESTKNPYVLTERGRRQRAHGWAPLSISRGTSALLPP